MRVEDLDLTKFELVSIDDYTWVGLKGSNRIVVFPTAESLLDTVNKLYTDRDWIEEQVLILKHAYEVLGDNMLVPRICWYCDNGIPDEIGELLNENGIDIEDLEGLFVYLREYAFLSKVFYKELVESSYKEAIRSVDKLDDANINFIYLEGTNNEKYWYINLDKVYATFAEDFLFLLDNKEKEQALKELEKYQEVCKCRTVLKGLDLILKKLITMYEEGEI